MYKDFTLVLYIPLVIRRKLSVYKTFRKQPRPLLNVLCTFNSRPVSKEAGIYPSTFDVHYMAQKTQSHKSVLKLNLHVDI